MDFYFTIGLCLSTIYYIFKYLQNDLKGLKVWAVLMGWFLGVIIWPAFLFLVIVKFLIKEIK